MTVTLLQTDIWWAAPDANIREATLLLDSQPGSDLYVLPEMWSTGFATEPHGIAADESSSEALRWMQHEAARRRCALCGSLAVRLADGTFRNRHYFADGRTGSLHHYDKHHLFTYGHEDRYYTPGQAHTVVSYGGFRLLLLTCYDLRFPLWSRYANDLQYDAIVLVANWPQARQSAWQLLTRARAIENECYVVAVNRVGDDHFGHYAGGSCVIDSYGKTVARCRQHAHQAVTCQLDLAELQRRRQKFRVLDDRDRP